MSVYSGRPSSGVRITVERPREGGPPWVYEGSAEFRAHSLSVRAIVSANGDVDVVVDPDKTIDAPALAPGVERPPSELRADQTLADAVRLLLRQAYRHAAADDAPPPMRLNRWRPERGS